MIPRRYNAPMIGRRFTFRFLPALLLAAILICTGCVRRTLSITSEPAGALVWLNDREIGRTPIEVDFLHYGTYDVRLHKDGYEPLLTSGDAKAPWWDSIPIDLVSEMLPGEHHSRVAWHYVLQPRDDDPQALLQRAVELRSKAAGESAPTPAKQDR